MTAPLPIAASDPKPRASRAIPSEPPVEARRFASTFAITADQVDEIVNRAIALRSSPARDSYAWLALLCAIDVVLGNDDLTDTIADLEYDLGIDDGPEYIFARTGGEGFDGDLVEVRSAWGMGR